MFKLTIKKLPWRGDEVKAQLEAAGKGAARRAADFVAGRAAIYCPVDTGELRASIAVVSSMGGATWHVMATAKHARAVEFGSMHGGTFIPPNPFLRKALADGKREFPGILKGAMVAAKSGQHLGATFRV